MESDNSIGNNDDFSMDDVSLESILAEYKGSAFINGDKRTPSELLNEETERIIREALGGSIPDSLSDAVSAVISENIVSENPVVIEDFEEPSMWDMSADLLPEPETWESQPDTMSDAIAWEEQPPQMPGNSIWEEQPPQMPGNSIWEEQPPQMPGSSIWDEQPSHIPEQTAWESQPANMPDVATREESINVLKPLSADYDGERDSVYTFFENYGTSEPEAKDTIIKEVEMAVEREIGYEEIPLESTQFNYGIIDRNKENNELYDFEEEDEIIEEPMLIDALKRFSGMLNSISYRVIPAAIIALIMIILTLSAEAGLIIPFGIGKDIIIATGVLIVMLLFVMMLCIDIIIRGLGDLLRGAPNAETLLLFSCAFSIISGAFSMIRGVNGFLPYCTVSAVSLTMAAFGEKLSLRAIHETLKTAMISSEPYGIQAEYNTEIDKSVLKKAFNRTGGFYSNLLHPDAAETAYRYSTPILLAAALILSVVKVAVKGGGEHFLHTLSALLAAAAPFSAMLAYSIPFGIIAKSGRKSGSAIAGWGGVDDICFTDGASVTDDDLFPPGTMSFNGVKLYGEPSPEKVIRYTSSLIMASGSGLSRLFAEVLKSQKMEASQVNDFTCYEGGIGAWINGEYVVIGSAAFMNLQSIRIEDDDNMKNAIFTAFDNKLVAMFAVEYMPVNSVQSALISMLKWRIKLFFTMRDFNVTPLMLGQKFKVSLEDIEYVQIRESYSISDSFSGKHGRIAALLAREGLGPFAEAITGGRLLKSSTLIATAVSVISASLGVLFMFYMFWNESLQSARPGNLLLFMFCTLAAVLVVCGYVRCKK